MRFRTEHVLGAILAAACAVSCAGQARSVALTFDDLPLARDLDAAVARQVNAGILAALAAHHAPAIGFVNERKIQTIGEAEGRKILREWIAKGQDLGNHTFAHRDLSELTVDQFRSEVIAGEKSLAEVLGERGRRLKFLRFPFNHSGETEEKRDAAAAFLAERGYAVATCTMDNSDWQFARAYDLMNVRGDRAAAAKLESEYLAYTAAEIDHYTRLHKTVFGRETPHVMLLHANRLNAALLDRVLRLFERRGYRFVTLEEAQSDHVYGTPGPVSKSGPMWGYRWARERGVPVDGTLEPEPPEWVIDYCK